ncbi:MAG: DinB family protein [Chloroflexi bacterium]|nr:DinB family protein [Chloroflexota bacterium]
MMNAAELFSHWNVIRQGLFQALDKLSDEQLRFVPREGLWSLGIVACHIAEAEDGWFRYVVRRELDAWPEYPAADYLSIASVKALLGEVHDRTEKYLTTVPVDALDQVIDLPWSERMTLRQVVWHVLEHEIHHRGEIFLMLGLMGMQAPDI